MSLCQALPSPGTDDHVLDTLSYSRMPASEIGHPAADRFQLLHSSCQPWQPLLLHCIQRSANQSGISRADTVLLLSLSSAAHCLTDIAQMRPDRRGFEREAAAVAQVDDVFCRCFALLTVPGSHTQEQTPGETKLPCLDEPLIVAIPGQLSEEAGACKRDFRTFPD